MRASRAAKSRRLGWKLAQSHLKVTLISQAINLIGVGFILVAFGQVPVTTPADQARMTLTLTVFFGVFYLLVSAISSGVAAAIGVRLARTFSQRLELLASATEAIVQGDLSARVAVTEADEISQIAHRFNLLTRHLEAAEQTRRRFVSNISHELRTPLAIIRGHVESQLAESPDSTASAAALEAIQRESEVLGRLIDDLFTLARIEESSLPVQPRPVALRGIIDAAVQAIRPLAKRRGHITVHTTLLPSFPPVMADPTRLAQILNNLLYNALRHTPDGGLIVIEGSSLPDGKMLEISVTDTGVGIAPADLPHIFDRFFHAQSESGGSGLGLTIVKQLVEAQGGWVRAESIVGQGTTIRFTLPRAVED